MNLRSFFSKLQVQLIIPVVVISIIGGLIGSIVIEKEMEKQIEKNAKQELENMLNEVYFQVASSFKILFFEYGSEEKRFKNVQKFVKKELISQLDNYVKKSQTSGLVILEGDDIIYMHPDGPRFEFDFLQQVKLDKSKKLTSEDRSYSVLKEEFIPWDWKIYALKNEASLLAIISENKQLVLATIASIILFVLLFMYIVILKGVQQPLVKILEKLSRIKDGKYEKIAINASYEMNTLAQNINATSLMIQQREHDIKEQLKYTQGILEAQESIVAIADRDGVRDANRMFFETFSEFSDVNDFRAKHDCICDFFIDCELDGYIGKVEKKDSFELYKKSPKISQHSIRSAWSLVE